MRSGSYDWCAKSPETAVTVVLSLLLLVPLATAATAGPVPDAQPLEPTPVPSVSVSLDPPTLEAEVTQEQQGAVTFEGTIAVEQPRVMSSTGTIQTNANTGWPCILSEQSFEITGPGEVMFQLTVIVPPATSSLLSGMVTVTCSLKPPGMAPAVGTGTATVTVGQYHKLRLQCSDPSVTAGDGDTVEVEVQICNDGNGPIEAEVTVVSVDEGITVKLGTGSVRIDGDDHENVTLRIDVTGDASTGSHSTVIRVVPAGVEGFVAEDLSVVVVVKSALQRFGVGLAAGLVTVAVVAVAVVALMRAGRLPAPGILRPRDDDGKSDDGEADAQGPAPQL